MAYVKNTWVDQEGQVRYTETEDGGYKIFTPNFEQVTEIGTPVNADNMNHIEDGIADCYAYVNTQITAMLSTIYPVGSIYISTSATNPLEALFGTWQLITGGLTLQQANVTYPVGTEIPAGLPNITGTAIFKANIVSTSGAFYQSRSNLTKEYSSGEKYGDKLAIDASRSSSIYGNSTTVQPPALAVNIWRRVA